MTYLELLRSSLGLALILSLVGRFQIRGIIMTRLGHHSGRKWKKRKKGQSFWEWLFFDRFGDIAPDFIILYYLIVVNIFVVFAIVLLFFHYLDKDITYNRLIDNIYMVLLVVLYPTQLFVMMSKKTTS